MPRMGSSLRMGDLGMGGKTTQETTNADKSSIPLAGPPVNVLNAANRIVSNAPVFWLIAILAILGLLKAGFEWKINTGLGVRAGT